MYFIRKKEISRTFILLLAGSVFLFSRCTEFDYYAPMECLTGNVKYDTTGAEYRLNVASVAMRCDTNKARNLEKIGEFTHRIMADHPQLDLILFGEMILGWYEHPDDQKGYQEGIAETIPGPSTELVSALAARYGVTIAFGMVQNLGGELYNAQPVIGPDGSLLAVHHKTYMTPADEEAGFIPGEELTVMNISGIRTGLVICKDQENSLLTKEVFEKGCKVVLLSFADDVVEDYLGIGSDLSRKYNAWLLTSNRFGWEGEVYYKGEIRVSDPGGNHRVMMEEAEQYLYYSIPIH